MLKLWVVKFSPLPLCILKVLFELPHGLLMLGPPLGHQHSTSVALLYFASNHLALAVFARAQAAPLVVQVFLCGRRPAPAHCRRAQAAPLDFQVRVCWQQLVPAHFGRA